MLKGEIKINQFCIKQRPKKHKSQLMLTFKTNESNHEPNINPIENKS
jgi:hypothetical protein